MDYIFPVTTPSISISNSIQHFPVRRIYCVGKNYADHALEMGGDPSKESPCFFSKPANAIVCNGEDVPYPTKTENLHYEVELVLAIGDEANAVSTSDASKCLFGYAVGIDLTRRDLQNDAKNAGRPWDVAKGFDGSAPLSIIRTVEEIGYLEDAAISLTLNGETRQQGNIANMTWKIPEIIAELSSFYVLKPGDLVFTGTPAGVDEVHPGDEIIGSVEGLEQVKVRVT